MHFVSIIIPVYNGSKYIAKGLYSILGQTYSAIEAVIVDDGSNDGSGETINGLINEKDTGISFKYIVQTNRGVAMARNRGLEEASGDYIMFMDQDDWLEEDCVETLVTELEKHQSDLVIGGFQLVDDRGKIREKWGLDERYEWSRFRITAPWGRIFRRSVIEDKHLRFMDTKISEDLFFNILFMSFTEHVKVISYVGYNWYYNERSESRTNWNVMMPERNPLIMLDELHRRMHRPNSMRDETLTYFFAKYIMWYLLYSAKGSSAEIYAVMYADCIEWLRAMYPGWRKNRFCLWKNPGGEPVKTHFIVMICVWLYRLGILYPILYLYHRI